MQRVSEIMQCRRCGEDYERDCLCAMGVKLPIGPDFCDDCYPIALADFEKGEAAKEKEQREDYWRTKIAADAFQDTDPAALPDQQALAEIMAWKMGPRGLVIHGKSGRGKTRMLLLLLRRLFVEDKIQVLFIRATAFARRAGDLNQDKVDAYLRELTYAPVLAIDDIGKEASSERVEAGLLEILERRSAFRRPTMITTNYVGDSLAARFRDVNTGDAIVRRLREFSEAVCATQRA